MRLFCPLCLSDKLRCVQGASPSLLWPNLIDALYALLRAFSEPQHQNVSRQWVFGALRDDQVSAALSEEVGWFVASAFLFCA